MLLSSLLQSEGETQCLSFSDLHSLILVYVSKVAKNGLVCPLLHALASDQSDSPGLDSGMNYNTILLKLMNIMYNIIYNILYNVLFVICNI